MLQIDNLEFKKLDINGLQTLVSWAKQEGWNPGKHDADTFFATDPDGFCGYYYNGELIAGGSIVSFSGNFGFMGFFIVRADMRGHGIGRRIWRQRKETLLSRLKPGAAIGMDGVVTMQPFYHKGGFELSFRDMRYEKTGEQYTVSPYVNPVAERDFQHIIDYDRACTGYARDHFMKLWLSQPDAGIFKYVEADELKGFAVVREADTGYRIGPLFADNIAIAEELYRACLAYGTGKPVYLDIPMINEEARRLVTKYEATSIFECGRMYLATPPPANMEKVFGLTSFELG